MQIHFCLILTFIVVAVGVVRGFSSGDKTFPSRTHFSEFSWFQERQGEKKLQKTPQLLPWVCFKFSLAFSDTVPLRQIMPFNSGKWIQHDLKIYRLGANKSHHSVSLPKNLKNLSWFTHILFNPLWVPWDVRWLLSPLLWPLVF